MDISNIAASASASPVNIKMASPRFSSPKSKTSPSSRKPSSPSRSLSSKQSTPQKSLMKSSSSSSTPRSSHTTSPRSTSSRANVKISSAPEPLALAIPPTPPPDHTEQLAAARRDFEATLVQQRHDALAKLLSALNAGAEYHYSEQRTQLYEHLYQHFHPNIVYDLRRLITICGLHIFEINRRAIYDTDIMKLKQRHLITDNHIQIVLTILNNYKKRCLGVLFYYDKKFQKYNQVHSILAEREAYWKEKTAHDVRKLNEMKLGELRISKSLANALHISSDDLSEDLSPLPSLTPLRESSKITSSHAVTDDFMTKSNRHLHPIYVFNFTVHRVKIHLLERINKHCSAIEADINNISLIGTDVSESSSVPSNAPQKNEKSVLIHKAHHHVAQLRHIAMQIDVFVENQRATSKQLKLQLRSLSDYSPDAEVQSRLGISSTPKK